MKFALRSLLKSPGFTAVALLTLALAIGVNTSMYTMLDSFLFRPAPFPESRQILRVLGETPQGLRYSFSEVETREIAAQAPSFASLTVLRFGNTALAEPGRPAEQIVGVQTSADFFATFRTQPFLGRAFTADEAQPGRNHVVLLSYAFWQKHYAGDPAVVGRQVRLDGESVTIIGVMPASFDWRFLWGPAALWRPLNFTPEQLKSRTYRSFNLIGRLAPGASAASATSEIAVAAAHQLKDFPQDYTGIKYRAVVLHEAQMDDDSRHILWMLLGLSGFVLLIACANLANLQLARATLAAREFAIRAALGASRRQLIVQQLTESVLLSVIGGGLGVLVALWINQALAASIHIANEPGGLDLPLDPTVLGVTFGVSACTGILFGIVPAWLASRTDVVTA